MAGKSASDRQIEGSETGAGYDSTRGWNTSSPLLGRLRQCCETFPDKRRGMNTIYSIADIGMAAFSVFFMQSPSFLAHQRQLREGHGRSNCESLFGLARIPSDNHIRDMLDPVAPALLHPVFAAVLAELERSDGLSAFRRTGEHVLIALDGTEYFCSNKIGCAQCSKRLRGDSRTEYYHAMLGATLVAPGEHSYGHGKQNLAALLVTFNLLAFAFHTVCDQSRALVAVG
jgi:hypothetical protein